MRHPGTGRNSRSWTRFFSASAIGSIVGDDVGGKETPERFQLFAFPSGKRKEEVKNIDITQKDVRINQQRRHRIGQYLVPKAEAKREVSAISEEVK